MNCENYQDLLSDFMAGSLTPEEHNRIEGHLNACGFCAEARSDLEAIMVFCRDHRGEYDAVPNERALWLRISNTIESESVARTAVPKSAGRWFRLMNRSWQLSFPQLAAAASLIIVVVALVTIGGLHFGFTGGSSRVQTAGLTIGKEGSTVEERYRQRQQMVEYWNRRVELNKARWNPQMRETFDRNIGVIDAAVNDSLLKLNLNPHDEVSEDILNAALNDKLELLKEFAEL